MDPGNFEAVRLDLANTYFTILLGEIVSCDLPKDLCKQIVGGGN
jgi:hypothetical protein